MASEYASAFGLAMPGQIVIGPTRGYLEPVISNTVTNMTGDDWARMTPFPVKPVRSGSRLNRAGTKAEDKQLTLAADGAPVRFGYGRDRIGAQVLNVLGHGSHVVVQLLWGIALDSIESVTLGDSALPSGVTRTDYTGAQVTADATMVAAFAAQSPPVTYSAALTGYSYTVLKIPAKDFATLDFKAVVNWRKVYDYRTGTTIGTDNPSLALADFLTSSVYGCGFAVDSASVQAAANWNDTAMSGGEKQRLIGWTCTAAQRVDDVLAALQTYASVFLVRRGATVYLVPDKAAASVATYAHASGDIAAVSSLRKRDLSNAPTQVEVLYTDTSKTPWAEGRAVSPPLPDEIQRRLSTVRLEGIQRYSQAYREAVERRNKLGLNDLSFTLTVWDRGIKHEVGDVVTVTLGFAGITSKLMRVIAPPRHAGSGQWALDLDEYDPAVYSTDVQSGVSYADTVLDDPAAPPAPAGVSAAEEVYQLDNGTFASRARLTITAPTYQWTAGYRIEVYAGASLIDAGTTITTAYATPPLQEGVPYSVRAYTLSTINAVSAAYASASLTPAGKSLPPGDVATLSGFEVAGDVYLNWTAAVDLDIWRYEIRYSATGGTWDAATLVDRIDGLRAVIRGTIPAGTWKFWIKAIDSVGQYSATPATLTLTVTLDPDALATGAAFTSPTLTEMTAFQRERGGATLWVTDPDNAGDKFGALFTAALGTYANLLADYHTSATSSWLSEVYDFGQDTTGDWSVDAVYSMLSGTVGLTLQLATAAAYPTFTDYTSLPTKQTARYVRVKLEATTTETLLVESVTVAVAAVTRKEFGTRTCAATGTDTVTLENVYSARRRIVLTPIEVTAARIAVADNITFGDPSSFDIYLFNDAGTRVAGDVAWAFEGI